MGGKRTFGSILRMPESLGWVVEPQLDQEHHHF
jgi:hypothetical protein